MRGKRKSLAHFSPRYFGSVQYNIVTMFAWTRLGNEFKRVTVCVTIPSHECPGKKSGSSTTMIAKDVLSPDRHDVSVRTSEIAEVFAKMLLSSAMLSTTSADIANTTAMNLSIRSLCSAPYFTGYPIQFISALISRQIGRPDTVLRSRSDERSNSWIGGFDFRAYGAFHVLHISSRASEVYDPFSPIRH